MIQDIWAGYCGRRAFFLKLAASALRRGALPGGRKRQNRKKPETAL